MSRDLWERMKLRTQRRKVLPLLRWVGILCALDLIFTGVGLQLGYMRELNPLMHAVWDLSPWAFALTKSFLTFAGLYLLYRFADHQWVRPVAYGLFATYAVLTAWHLGGLCVS